MLELPTLYLTFFLLLMVKTICLFAYTYSWEETFTFC